MKKSIFKKIARGLYKAFLTFMICISLAADPAVTNELKKMFDYLNEVRIEQMIEEETDDDEPEDW